jgi:hypothetical protein
MLIVVFPDVYESVKAKKIYIYRFWFFFFGIYLLNKVEFLLLKSIVYLHRKKRRFIKKKKIIYIFVMFCLNVQVKNPLLVFFRELICLPSSRFCDFVGSSREKKKKEEIIVFTNKFRSPFIHDKLQRRKKNFI